MMNLKKEKTNKDLLIHLSSRMVSHFTAMVSFFGVKTI